MPDQCEINGKRKGGGGGEEGDAGRTKGGGKGGRHLMVAGETDLDIGDFKRGFSH